MYSAMMLQSLSLFMPSLSLIHSLSPPSLSHSPSFPPLPLAPPPQQQVLVVYYNRHQNFEVVTVPSYATASDILNDRDLKVQLDISGIDNTGLFLKARDEEHMFMNLESPCDVLFELDLDGVLRRQPVGTHTCTCICTQCICVANKIKYFSQNIKLLILSLEKVVCMSLL